MMTRVTCFRDPSLDPLYPERWPAVVKIQGRDGRTHLARVDHPKGDPENPLTWEETEAKFHALAASAPPEARSSIVRLVASIEELADLRSLTQALSRATITGEVKR